MLLKGTPLFKGTYTFDIITYVYTTFKVIIYKLNRVLTTLFFYGILLAWGDKMNIYLDFTQATLVKTLLQDFIEKFKNYHEIPFNRLVNEANILLQKIESKE